MHFVSFIFENKSRLQMVIRDKKVTILLKVVKFRKKTQTILVRKNFF